MWSLLSPPVLSLYHLFTTTECTCSMYRNCRHSTSIWYEYTCVVWGRLCSCGFQISTSNFVTCSGKYFHYNYTCCVMVPNYIINPIVANYISTYNPLCTALSFADLSPGIPVVATTTSLKDAIKLYKLSYFGDEIGSFSLFQGSMLFPCLLLSLHYPPLNGWSVWGPQWNP